MVAPSAAIALSAALREWIKFLSCALATRLDADTFESYVALLQSQYPLPPAFVADLLLRPSPGNHDFPDPRILEYFQALLKLKLVDTTSVLDALYRYSTSRTKTQGQVDAGDESLKDRLLWGNSYGTEEVIFYRLTKAVAQGTGIKPAREALLVAKVMAKWMALFTAVSASFAADAMGALYPSQIKEEMETARAAFVMLLLGVCENQTLLTALKGPAAKGRSWPFSVREARNPSGVSIPSGLLILTYRCSQAALREPGQLRAIHRS